ncbi:MAG: hypothetical protein IJS90_05135 [Clostridia bacterium]|nr:hypothetical protein [Clostridia bacterium]
MNLDFSLSTEDWIGYFRQFLDILVSFFNYIGLRLFNDSEGGEVETNESETAGA